MYLVMFRVVKPSPVSLVVDVETRLIYSTDRSIRHCSTSQKLAGLIPDGVSGIFV
jgi:hypothetical protein